MNLKATIMSERGRNQGVYGAIISFIEMFRIVKSMETERRLVVPPLGSGREKRVLKSMGFLFREMEMFWN